MNSSSKGKLAIRKYGRVAPLFSLRQKTRRMYFYGIKTVFDLMDLITSTQTFTLSKDTNSHCSTCQVLEYVSAVEGSGLRVDDDTNYCLYLQSPVRLT